MRALVRTLCGETALWLDALILERLERKIADPSERWRAARAALRGYARLGERERARLIRGPETGSVSPT